MFEILGHLLYCVNLGLSQFYIVSEFSNMDIFNTCCISDVKPYRGRTDRLGENLYTKLQKSTLNIDAHILVDDQPIKRILGVQHKKTSLHVNSEGQDQSAHPCSLIRIFIVHQYILQYLLLL